MKILYVADIHGSETCYRKFLNALTIYKADAGIIMGDLTGKMINPIVKQADGSYIAHVLGSSRRAVTAEEVAKLQKDIASMGNYSFLTEPGEMALLKAEGKSIEGRIDERAASIHLSAGRVDDMFRRLVTERMHSWMDLADERLEGSGIEVFMVPGNDDLLEIDPIIEESKTVTFCDGKNVMVGEYEMISESWSNPTPWETERECPEEELEKKLEAMASRVRNPETAIFNFHVPPYNTLIDQAPKLSADLVPSTDETIPAGSRAVSAIIRKYQPLMGCHGHIHESRGIVTIGRTQCFNPGSEYSEGILRGIIFFLKKDKLKDFMFISG
ncbi:MAG: metallophosphoesterase [Spirochaetales bacterium]|nr:MAG: metallophosphoesterase [Spirochaetales bacterium]